MDWSNLTDTLLRVAPTIAGMVGGPIGSMAVQGLESVFGLTPGTGADAKGNPSPALESAILGMNPDQAIALAKIDAELKGKLIDAGISYENIAAGDRNSARTMRIQAKDPTSSIVGVLILCIWAYVNISLLKADHAPAVGDMVVGRILGMIDAATLAVVYFLYGSSAGSAKKDDTITALSK